jgi:hypothetical protein
MSPPAENVENALPAIPATAPVKKHVNFSSSTLERASHDELGKSPSPMKFRAGSEVPAGAVIYPSLGSSAQHPDLSQEIETLTASPSRRLTFGGETPNHPRSFSFESGKTVNFGRSMFVFVLFPLTDLLRSRIYWHNPHGSSE